MHSRSTHLGLLAALMAGFVAATGSAAAADPAPTTDKTDWSKFVAVSTITAEVRTADADSITLRVYWTAPGAGSTGSGNNNRRPSLYHSSRGGRGQSNPLQQMM